jgi:tripartite-type tricarboxylate transporter receptor subunit TctC
MPGGGALIGVNYMGEIAKPDGLAVIIWTWSPILHLMKDPNLRVPLSQFNPIGGIYFGDVAYMRSDALKKYNAPADFAKLDKFWFGGLGASNYKDIMGRLQLDLLGADYGYLGTYRGSNDISLAVQRGELQYTTVSSSSWRGQIAPALAKTGEVRPLFQAGMVRGDTTIREPEMQDIPTFEEFYRLANGKEPTGEKWEMYKFLRSFRGAMSDTVLLPPKTPAAIVTTLRTAFNKAVADPRFVSDYQKLAQSKPLWLDGEGAEKVFERLRAADDEIGKFLADYVEQVVKK